MSQPAPPAAPPAHTEKQDAKQPSEAQGSAGSTLPQPAVSKPAAPKRKVHPAVIISIWIALSSSVIVYNKCVVAPAVCEDSH